jgi:hypothetical protein
LLDARGQGVDEVELVALPEQVELFAVDELLDWFKYESRTSTIDRRRSSDIDHHRTVLLTDGVEGDRLALGAPAVGEGESARVERTHDCRRVELPVGERAAAVGAVGLSGAQVAVAQAEHRHLLFPDRVRASFPGRDGVDRAQPVRGTPLRRRHAIAPVGFVPAGDDDPSRTGT